MTQIDKRYIPITDTISLELMVYYDLGNREKLRGYYLSASPVAKKKQMACVLWRI